MRRHRGGPFGAGAGGSESWTAEDEDRYWALFDPVTGLPRRFLMRDRVDVALARARRAQSFVAVFHLLIAEAEGSLDRPADVADVDRLCAERLCASVRTDDSVGRVADHEFVVVCHDIVDKEHSMLILRRFVEAFDTPLAISGTEHRVRATVGVALAYGTESALTLLTRARHSAQQFTQGQNA